MGNCACSESAPVTSPVEDHAAPERRREWTPFTLGADPSPAPPVECAVAAQVHAALDRKLAVTQAAAAGVRAVESSGCSVPEASANRELAPRLVLRGRRLNDADAKPPSQNAKPARSELAKGLFSATSDEDRAVDPADVELETAIVTHQQHLASVAAMFAKLNGDGSSKDAARRGASVRAGSAGPAGSSSLYHGNSFGGSSSNVTSSVLTNQRAERIFIRPQPSTEPLTVLA